MLGGQDILRPSKRENVLAFFVLANHGHRDCPLEVVKSCEEGVTVSLFGSHLYLLCELIEIAIDERSRLSLLGGSGLP